MIDLYTWNTDNGHKARHGAEESGLQFNVHGVNIRERKQFEPDFLAISPGHKIPALIDNNGPGGNQVTLCESGAILKYLGEKADNGLYPADPLKRVSVDQWLFYGSSTWTTQAQQYGLFWQRFPEDVPQAKAHYEAVVRDNFDTFDRHLRDNEYFSGNYSVADISIYADVHVHGPQGRLDLAEWPNLKRWHDAIETRPAVQRAWVPLEG